MVCDAEGETVSRCTIKLSEASRRTITSLRCKKCRFAFASAGELVEHEPGIGQAAFSHRKRGTLLCSTAAPCTSYHIQAMKWDETPNSGGVEGKILCPKC